MRASRFHAFGPFENLTLEDVQSPDMSPHRVKIAVHAAGMCIADNLMIEGKYQQIFYW